jgi:serine/threonine-protein kinase
MRNLAGQSLDKYQITDEIGRGGMGIVYRVYDVDLHRYVALKVLLPHLVGQGTALERFRREAVTIASLKHPSIVTVHDVGESGGHYYIAMELVEGRDLNQEVREKGAMPLPQVTRIVHQLASALDYAHKRSIIHRDVKSGNVILGEGEHVTLTDFGLARLRQDMTLTQTDFTVGTLKCMAPEQITGDDIDHRVDIYALGILVYEVLCGRLPYSGDTPQQIFQDILFNPPLLATQLKPDLHVDIDPILSRALAKNPQDRYASAGEMAAALQRLRPVTGLKLVTAEQEEFPLRGLVSSIGRNPDNTVVLDSAHVSRYHAIIRSQAGAWLISDQGSTNGTFLNGKQLLPRESYPLQPGDVLRLGNYDTLYVYESKMTAQRPTETMRL